MKTVTKKLFSMLLVAVMLLSTVPFQAFADNYCHTPEHGTASTDIRIVDGGAKHVAYCDTADCPDVGKAVYGSGVKHNGADCAVCGYKAPVVCAHSDCTTTVTKAADCVNKGEQKTVCNTCGETVKVEEIPALGHKDADGDKICDICKKYLGSDSDIKPTGTLRLDPNDGTASITVMNVAYGKALNTFGALPIPSREGYDFDGWFIGDKFITGATVCDWASGAQTATAHWTLKTKNLTVRVLFEDGSVATQIIYDKGVTEGTNLLKFLNNNAEIQQRITACKNAHPGYEWYEEYFYDYSGTKPLTSQDQKMNIAQEVYIRFTPKTFKLSFEAGQGASCPTEYKNVRYNKTVGPLPTPTKSGSVFAGWVDNSDGGKVYNQNTVYLLTRDTTLTAVWAEKAVVILHVYLNGSFLASNCDDYVLDGYAKKNPITGLYNNVTRADVAKFVTARYTPNSGSSLQIDGLFSEARWADYKKNTSIKGSDTVQINDVDVQKGNPTNVYVMIRNAHRGGYNPTTPWDPSNPKTGDNFALLPMVSVMVLAAAGFVTLAIVRKKKFN